MLLAGNGIGPSGSSSLFEPTMPGSPDFPGPENGERTTVAWGVCDRKSQSLSPGWGQTWVQV